MIQLADPVDVEVLAQPEQDPRIEAVETALKRYTSPGHTNGWGAVQGFGMSVAEILAVADAVGGDLVQSDVNQRVPDSSVAAGTSIGGDLPKPDEAPNPERIPASRDDWMSREFDRAAKRQAAIPPHARLVITHPPVSGVLPEQPDR